MPKKKHAVREKEIQDVSKSFKLSDSEYDRGFAEFIVDRAKRITREESLLARMRNTAAKERAMLQKAADEMREKMAVESAKPKRTRLPSKMQKQVISKMKRKKAK